MELPPAAKIEFSGQKCRIFFKNVFLFENTIKNIFKVLILLIRS
jgi:hypothetical protein